MMNRIVHIDQVVPFDDFPYDWKHWDYSAELLRSVLYVPCDPNLTEDEDHVLVLDYDGFLDFFPKWNEMYREENGDDWYADDAGADYLPYHIGRTVDVIKEVIE